MLFLKSYKATHVLLQQFSHMFSVHIFCTKKLQQKIKVPHVIHVCFVFYIFFGKKNRQINKKPILGLWLGLHVSILENTPNCGSCVHVMLLPVLFMRFRFSGQPRPLPRGKSLRAGAKRTTAPF